MARSAHASWRPAAIERLRGEFAVEHPPLIRRPFNIPLPSPLAAEFDLPEPPTGTPYTYGRVNGTWVPVVPLSGATLLGRLCLSEDYPELDREGSTKLYVDEREIDLDGGTY